MQERRTYIPQGWVKFYEFSPGDLRIGTDILESAVARMVKTGSNVVQWDYIHGLFELAIYGGKIDDIYDQRVLKGYLAKYFNNETLANKPGRQLMNGLNMPSSNRAADYQDIVSNLPQQENPAIFGLPDNVDQAVQMVNASYVYDNLQSMGRTVDATGGFDREKWAKELGPILKLWQQLCGNGDILAAPTCGEGGAEDSPIESFVYLEVANAHKLVSLMDGSLGALQRVLKGTTLLTSSIVSDANAIMAGEVPAAWDGLWEGPLRPAAYLRAVAGRAAALKSWVHRVGSQQLLKTNINLSDLFRPANFLNALRQQAARTYRVSMDRLKLVTAGAGTLGKHVSITVEGMLLQGAVYNNSLSEVAADSKVLSVMPALSVAWVRDEEAEQYQGQNTAKIPMYLTPTREVLVTELALDCSGDPMNWTIGGTLVCLSAE
jgi:dynein heavy chain 2, cytosolic